MAKYIPLDALVAEIKRRIKAIPRGETDKRLKAVYGNEAFVLTDLLNSLDTLEVKEVELDMKTFGEEMTNVFNLPSNETTNTEEEPLNWEYAIAKHFFELGMCVSNPITAEDRGTDEENNELTWEDIDWIVGEAVCRVSEDSEAEQICKEVLKRFLKERKGK